MQQNSKTAVRKSKYGNIRCVGSNGEKFDSQKEMNRYGELQRLERCGKIKELSRQVKFVLIPSQKQNNKIVERECSYFADFTYYDFDTQTYIVEDVKGKKTEVYKIKRKLMLAIHGIKILET